MKKLRITPKRKFADTWGTGDYQNYFKYEVRRDFTPEELSRHNYSPEVITNGVVIEEFNSEDNAKIFVKALCEEKELSSKGI